MRYIYPALMRQYNTYIKSTNKNAMREFHMTVDELRAIAPDDLTPRQREFLKYYKSRMPVETHNCVMNRICRRFEQVFDGCVGRHNSAVKFDYEIMKSGAEYTRSQYNAILKLYESYNRHLQNYAVFANYERVDEYESFAKMSEMRSEFLKECAEVCPNEKILCDIVLDICYQRNSTKRFAWEICGSQIIRNLLTRSEGVIRYPTLDEDGEISYCGKRFTVKTEVIGVEDEYYPE